MTVRELLQLVKSDLESKSVSSESKITVTRVYGENDQCVVRAMIPENNKIRVVEINVKELCLYEGLHSSGDSCSA